MIISDKSWQEYLDRLRRVNSKAADLISQYIQTHEIESHEGHVNLLDYVSAVVTKYSEGAAEAACEMYDAIAEASGKVVPPAEPAPTPTFGDVAKTLNGTMKHMTDPDGIGASCARLVKRTGVDTTMKNAIRDGAEWAWIPHGDTCGFCLMLASNGWQPASKKALKGGHAEHIHPNCDCTYAIRFDGKSNVAGYDPDALYEKYLESGFSRGERLRNLQKEYRDGKKNGIINIDLDGLVPCLRDTKSGEIVDTVVSQVTNKNELKSFSKKNGWYVNWKDVPKDVEVYKLQVKGNEDVQGLIGVRPDRDHGAVYLHWAVAAPQNNPLMGDGTKKYEGVGGHLFAIGAEVSMNNGFGGAMYGYAANKDLVDLYVNHYGAIHLPIEHEYEVFFDEAAAMNILKEYNYEHK